MLTTSDLSELVQARPTPRADARTQSTVEPSDDEPGFPQVLAESIERTEKPTDRPTSPDKQPSDASAPPADEETAEQELKPTDRDEASTADEQTRPADEQAKPTDGQQPPPADEATDEPESQHQTASEPPAQSVEQVTPVWLQFARQVAQARGHTGEPSARADTNGAQRGQNTSLPPPGSTPSPNGSAAPQSASTSAAKPPLVATSTEGQPASNEQVLAQGAPSGESAARAATASASLNLPGPQQPGWPRPHSVESEPILTPPKGPATRRSADTGKTEPTAPKAPAAPGYQEPASPAARLAGPTSEAPAVQQDSTTGVRLEQVVRVLRSSLQPGHSQVRIQLHPPQLGELRIDVDLRENVLTLQVRTQTTQVREFLLSRVPELRQSLENHGITLERFHVEVRAAEESPPGREQLTSDEHPSAGRSQEDAHGQAAGHDGTEPSEDDTTAPDVTDEAAGSPEDGDEARPATESSVDLVA